MLDTTLCLTDPKPSLLLMELSKSGFSEAALQIEGSRFRVTRADSASDVYLLRDALTPSVAVLSDTIGFFALRTTAQMVRAQWPKARIIILGRAPSGLDDQLYDESVDSTVNGSTLIRVLTATIEEPWNRMGRDAYATWLGDVSQSPQFQQNNRIQESDPRKVSAPVGRNEDGTDWPGTERLRRVVV